MGISFEEEYLRELYEAGKTTNKKYRFQPDVVKRYQARIKTLERASKIEDLYAINSLHYEMLRGDKKGISSIRVNDQYRIEFKATQIISETVVTICNILELSNHYK
jgi:proteic killer suppression protein